MTKEYIETKIEEVQKDHSLAHRDREFLLAKWTMALQLWILNNNIVGIWGGLD